ncbi:hypothetical protein thsps21_45940 [Pseudomonas sp. No.21]|jgi:hypothetical protein|uniref:hypothetical protein n=1 Tax=Pseudomonas TaxID=286 RepID=UPI0011B5D473|nr:MULTISPECIES: hypothetical protein [Pseudomonas]MDW3713556.1 hypothetical protein [Pseudomonas sp. 2023EL-01195]GJN46955.1 hypothetical protein TUM20249_29410 [Pseudomonas tohonis]
MLNPSPAYVTAPLALPSITQLPGHARMRALSERADFAFRDGAMPASVAQMAGAFPATPSGAGRTIAIPRVPPTPSAIVNSLKNMRRAPGR